MNYLRYRSISSMSTVLDDKTEHCIPFILERLQVHRRKYADNKDAPPFFLGFNGVQGAGKTTIVSVPEHQRQEIRARAIHISSYRDHCPNNTMTVFAVDT